MNICRDCGLNKKEDEFGFIKRLNRLDTQCRVCKNTVGRANAHRYSEKNNKRDKVRYFLNKTEINRKQKIYREQNKEKIRNKSRRYYKENKEKIRNKNNIYNANNRDKNRETSKQHYKENKKDYVARTAKRKAQRINATIGGYNTEIKEIYKNCPKGYHVDHIIPLNNPIVNGLHVPWNLQYLTAEENLRKSNKLLKEFI